MLMGWGSEFCYTVLLGEQIKEPVWCGKHFDLLTVIIKERVEAKSYSNSKFKTCTEQT